MMQHITRLVKGVLGVVMGAIAFAGLMLPIDTLIFNIDPREDIGRLTGLIAMIIGSIAGWVLLSKAKWWIILAVFVVLVMMFESLWEHYPHGYSAETDTFVAEVDGVSFDVSGAYAKYATGWLDIDAKEVHSKGMKVIIIHLYCSLTGSFTLNSDNQEYGNGAVYGFGKTKASLTSFATNSNSTGRVTISLLDLNAKKVSGTFEYRAIQIKPAGSRVVKVTGSFKDLPIR